MADFQTLETNPDQSFLYKVQQSVEFNDPAEVAYRDGRANAAAKKAAEVQYERRELVDDAGTSYVIEDREDGPYVIARMPEGQPVRHYGEQGLKIDGLPDDAVDRDVMDRVSEFAGGLADVGEGAMRGIGLGLTKFTGNVVRSAIDNPIGDFALGKENVQAFEDFTKKFLDNAEKVAKKSSITGDEFGTAGDIAVDVGDVTGQFIAPAGGLYKTFRAMGAGAVLSSVLADASVGFFGVSPETENSANLIPEDSEAFGALRDLIATDPEDGEFENRARNAVEAMALLGIGEAAGRGIVEMFKSGKNAIKAIEVPESVAKAIDKNVNKAIATTGAAGALAPNDAQGQEAEQPVYPGGPTPSELQETWRNNIGLDHDAEFYDTVPPMFDDRDYEPEQPEQPIDGKFDQVMKFTFDAEGGFANTKGDRGGATQFGISSKFYPKQYKIVRDLVKAGKEKEAKEYAASFYKTEFYDRVVTEDMNAREALVVFDAAVHHGQGTARKMWKQSGGNIEEFLRIRASKMKGIAKNDPSQQKFLEGWLNRVENLKEAARVKGVKVGALGDNAFKLLAEDMDNPNIHFVGGKTKLAKRAMKMLGGEMPGMVDEGTALAIRDSLKRTGKAEGIDFNLSRMETSEQLDSMINEISEIYKDPIDTIKGGVQTFNETQAKSDLARRAGFDVEAVLARQPEELWPAHKIKAARDIFVSELEKTEDLARAIKSGENTSENLIAFRRQLAVVSAVQSQIKGVQTETARALSQYRMTAKSPLEMQVNIAEMVQKSGGADTNEAMVDAFINAVENGGPDAAATFARNAEQVTSRDMLYEAWINSLLGSPATHSVNMLGNTLTIAQSTVERYAAATYGAVERGVGAAFGQNVGGITFREANALAQGQAMAVNDSMIAFLKALRSGNPSDTFGKIDHHGHAITTQNINELPLSQTIATKMMQGDELINSNSQLAHMIDFMGEYYYRLPGRMLMAEDEFFKTMNYRAELHALAAREASQQGLTKEQQAARIKQILADPRGNAPELHQQALGFAREQTFTTPPGPIADAMQKSLSKLPAGRVVVPFFGVINNITKYVASRVPGAALSVPKDKFFDTQTRKMLFSGDPAQRQLVMGRWATGGSLLGFGAWAGTNGIITGRMTDNQKMLNQIETTQNRKRYSMQLPGTDKMMNYNRLEPAGMLMAIAADTANAMAYVEDDEERENLVLAATAAIVPYMQDKAFFNGVSEFFEAINPQFGDDDARQKSLGRYITNLGATAPGAVLGPLAPNTPLTRNIKTNVYMDRAKRVAEANKWTIEKDQYGEDILVANSESYQLWDRMVNKIYAGTPGLSESLPADVNIWGEEIRYEGGLGPDIVTPIYTNTPEFDIKDLQGKNFPAQIAAGRFKDMRVGSDLTIKQHREFVDIVGINGELERLNMPLNKPRKDISARVNGKVVGLPVELNISDRIDLIKIMNEIRVPNEAHPQRQRMNMKETLNWMIKQEEYAKLPDDRDATGAKGDIIRKVYNEYKGAAIELFFANHPKGQAYFRKSIQMKQQAQNTGVQ